MFLFLDVAGRSLLASSTASSMHDRCRPVFERVGGSASAAEPPPSSGQCMPLARNFVARDPCRPSCGTGSAAVARAGRWCICLDVAGRSLLASSTASSMHERRRTVATHWLLPERILPVAAQVAVHSAWGAGIASEAGSGVPRCRRRLKSGGRAFVSPSEASEHSAMHERLWPVG